MDRSKAKGDGPYRDKLDPSPKRRYLEKISHIAGIDPYEHSDWTSDLNDLPPLSEAELVFYLVNGVSYYTGEEFRNAKALRAHGQTNFGWVQDLQIARIKEKTVVIAEVLHSQRLREAPLQPWVILHADGKVESAHCTCMAGVGESCSHVAAMLFKIEAAVRLRGSKTCTDEAAYWMLTRGLRKVEPAPVHAIDYSTAATRKADLDKLITGQGGAPGMRTRAGSTCLKAQDPTHTDMTPLYEAMHACRSVYNIGSEQYYQHYDDPVEPSVVPKSLQHLRDHSKDSCELPSLLQYCEGLRDAVTVSETQATALEKRTRQQHKAHSWYALRAGRITASMIHAVVSTRVSKPALSTVNAVCYPQKTKLQRLPEHLQWGIMHEEKARQKFLTMTGPNHKDLTVKQCGFIISPLFPEVGASPDGLTECSCCGKGCLEIKCPAKHRSNSVLEACEDKNFCLNFSNGHFVLKRTHKYYSQIQTQMFVTGAKFCYFVVWTLVDCEVVRITPDVEHWTSLLERAQNFFYKVALPELVACHFTQGSKKAPVLPEPPAVRPKLKPLTESQQFEQPRPAKKRKP